MPESKNQHTIFMQFPEELCNRVTTLLQFGIKLLTVQGTSLGVFLSSLPGFDQEYLSDRVQTIFYDGNAVDDLEQCFSLPSHTIALSAALPGLAGAIFRRNSLCAALRTHQAGTSEESEKMAESKITLKLFNAIATERGGALLGYGGAMSGEHLQDFFGYRPSLLEAAESLKINDEPYSPSRFLQSVERGREYGVMVSFDSSTAQEPHG